MELTTTSILALFETSKEQRQSFINDLLGRIDSGAADPLKVHLQIKCIEDIVKQLTSLDEKTNKNIEAARRYRAHLLDAAERYGKKFELFNAEFAVKETGSKYDYSRCNDNELLDLYKQQEWLKAKIKAKEDLLKTLPAAGLTKVDDSGEVYTIYPPSKSSTTSVTVTLK